VALVEEAVKGVKAAPLRVIAGRATEVPLTDARGGVAIRFKKLSNGYFIGVNSAIGVRSLHPGLHSDPPRIGAG